MPRILPRLLKQVALTVDDPKHFPFAPPRLTSKSLYKPVPPRPTFAANNYSRSILLAESNNPITSSHDYVQHKTLPPRVRLPPRSSPGSLDYDRPRQMSDNERTWSASPYLRMLASPIRQCIVSSRYLPSDFLIRLGSARLPPSDGKKVKDATILLPDGIQHRKFTARRSHRASYVLCLREAISMIYDRNKRLLANGMIVHPRLAEHISHLLRLRVLQELELLGDDLQHMPIADHTLHIPVRRLTRKELHAVRKTGTIPFQNAVAVVVVPPPNRDPMTKKRPEPSMSPLPPPNEYPRPPPAEPLPPLSVLYPSSQEAETLTGTLSDSRIPLYNGVSLFPNVEQRAALHSLLTRILEIERGKGYELSPTPDGATESRRFSGELKGSHAFLLTSDAETMRCGDMAAVAIALWRVRIFEGGGRDHENKWVP